MEAPTGTAERTVLYIDDDPANRRLMGRLFGKRLNAKLITCDSGGSGLDLARNESPDLVLLDVNIPGLSGQEVLAEMKSDPALANIPVVMISGDASNEQVQRFLEAGATSYVTKPFDLDDLVALIEGFLARRDAGAEAS